MSTQTNPYTININTTGGVTLDDIRVARDAADLDATATAAPDLTALRRTVDTWRFIRDRYDRDLEGYGAMQRAEYDVLLAALALFPEKDGTS